MIKISLLESVLEVIGQESYASLICSYGSQLRDATVAGLEHKHLMEVVNACTNFEATAYGPIIRNDWQHLHDLGPRVVWLHDYDN